MSWRENAACIGRDDIDWFPQGDGRLPAARANAQRAKAVCWSCPVRVQCLNEVLAEEFEPQGIRGGFTASERRRMPRPRVPKPIDHGTSAGYRLHRYRGEEPCLACMRGYADYQALRRLERRSSPA